jgi:serine/threonine protein kinase
MSRHHSEDEGSGEEYFEEGSGEEDSGEEDSGESEFEDDYGSEEERECEIDNDLVMPRLTVSCLKQHLPNGKKCFRNECLEVTKLISVSDSVSAFGNIVQVKNNEGETFIVKWNRYRDNVSEFKYEVRIQKVAYTLGIAPQILQVYEQKSERSRGGYIYIFMTDLIRLGYKSISQYFGTFNKRGEQTGFKKIRGERGDIPQIIIVKIAEALKKLHSVGIAHKDLHPGNVFTNGDRIVFIDFGLSEMYGNKEDAWRSEKYATTRKFITSFGTQTLHLIPNNWKDIKTLSKP